MLLLSIFVCLSSALICFITIAGITVENCRDDFGTPTLLFFILLGFSSVVVNVNFIDNYINNGKKDQFTVFCKSHKEEYKSHKEKYYVNCSDNIYKYKSYELWLEELELGE